MSKTTERIDPFTKKQEPKKRLTQINPLTRIKQKKDDKKNKKDVPEWTKKFETEE